MELNVYFDLDEDFVETGALAARLAGRKEHGVGTDFDERDMQFTFDSEEELQQARRRLAKAWFRFHPRRKQKP